MIKRLTRPFVSLPTGVNVFYDSIRAIRAYGSAVQILTTVDFNDITYIASSSNMASLMVQTILNNLEGGLTANTPLIDNTIATAIATPGVGSPALNYVTLTGNGLANSRYLVLSGVVTLFDVISATDTTVVSATTINVQGGNFDVTLLDAAHNVIAYLPSGLTITGITSVVPNSMTYAVANAGFTLDVYGAGFTNLGSESVTINGSYLIAGTITFISATHLQVLWPPGLGIAVGIYSMSYTNTIGSPRLDDALTIT